MIKKNTTVIFEDGNENHSDEMVGGMPLSIGELVHVHKENGELTDYEVVDKIIDCFMKSEDQEVNITYKLRMK